MGIGPLSRPSRRKSSPAIDQEALRIGAAMEHIGRHGNLDGFPSRRGERLALVSTAAKQGLLAWNRPRGKYELTSRGHHYVRTFRRSGRVVLRDRQGSALRSGVNAVVTAAGVVLVLGAAFLVVKPTGRADAPGRDAGGYSSSAMQASARTEPEPGARGHPEQAPHPGAGSGDARQVAAEVPFTIPVSGSVEPTPAVAPAEPATMRQGAIGQEPELATGAAAETSAAADPPETIKPAHKHKRASRRHEAPGYGFAPYAGAGQYRQWSPPPGWWSR